MPLKPGTNPYKILELEKGCTDKEIQKAYRAQCLKWHPDKNLNNKEEAERRFIEAKEAFDFLYDKEKRAEYDRGEERVRVAEERQRQRMEKADGARKKLIEELEKREEAFVGGKRSADGPIQLTPHQQAKKKKAAEDKMREEIEAMRKQLEKEANDMVKQQMDMYRTAKAEHRKASPETSSSPQLLVKWKSEESSEDYTENKLRRLFSNFGPIAHISPIISKKGKSKVIIEFEPGTNAWGAELETGNSPMPELTGKWQSPPVRAEKKVEPTTGGAGTTNGANTGKNFDHMSLDDLEASILA